MSRRQRLTPGRISFVPFSRTRMVARELRKGSRLVVIVAVNKNSGAQLNCGTGRDVSDESIADAAVPLKIRWHNDSCVSLPLMKCGAKTKGTRRCPFCLVMRRSMHLVRCVPGIDLVAQLGADLLALPAFLGAGVLA